MKHQAFLGNVQSYNTKRICFVLYPVSILHKSTAGLYRPFRVADGPRTARYRFIKNASWVFCVMKGNQMIVLLFFSHYFNFFHKYSK